MNMEERQDLHALVKQTAEFCETVFNSQSFQNLFSGDFERDEKIYELVGGAVMRYVNAAKDFDVDKVYRIFDAIKNSDNLKNVSHHIIPGEEKNLFISFFVPVILKNLKTKGGNMVDAATSFLLDMPKHYLLTNSFNGYSVARAKKEGLDCSQEDPFEKDYETLSALGFRKYSKNGIYFTDPSSVTMHFCHVAPERLYFALNMLPRKATRYANESLASYFTRKFQEKIEQQSQDPKVKAKITQNQVKFDQAVNHIVQAYSNETAGIAFIAYQDFLRLSRDQAPDYKNPDNFDFFREQIMGDHKNLLGKIAQGDQTEDEVLGEYLTKKLFAFDFCRGGIGRCLVNGKVGTDTIAVAHVPQYGLLSLNKQRIMAQEPSQTEVIK